MKRTISLAALTLFCAALFAGTGTKDDPYTCAEAIALQQRSGYNQALVWVKGFIVGVPCQGKKGKIEYTTSVGSEQCRQLALADDAYGADWMPMKMTVDTGNVAAKALSLCRHPENVGKKVAVRTVPQPFYGIPGAQNVIECEWLTPIAVTGVALDRSSAEIYVNQTLSLAATVSPADADNRRVTWSSSNGGVASVDAEGTVTALTNGEATITVATVDGAKTATCKITVTTASGEVLKGDVINADTTGITVNSLKDTQPNTWSGKVCASGTSYAGKTATEGGNMKLAGGSGNDQAGIVNMTSVGYIRQVVIKWAANSADKTINVYGTNVPWNGVSDLYNGADKTVSDGDVIGTLFYSSADKNEYDTVNVEGNFQYVGLWATNGKAHYFESVSFIWALTKAFDDVELKSLALDAASLTLTEDDTHRLNVAYNPTNATYKAVQWTSSNTAVATVDAGIVTAVAPGTATITVASAANPAVKASCQVTVTKRDIFAGRDLYYKVKALNELHTNDTVVLVCEKYNRVSGAFELDDKGVGRIVTPSTEIIRVGDTIGAWGAEEAHLVAVAAGQWKILAKQWTVDDNGIDVSEELALRAETVKNLQVKGEGTQTWTIAFHNGGDSVAIASTDPALGRIQFNGNNKTFCNYTSNQTALQIYRKKNQTTSDDDPIEDAVKRVSIDGVTYANGIIYNTQGLPLRIYSVAGLLMIESSTDIDMTAFDSGVYIICSEQGTVKVVK